MMTVDPEDSYDMDIIRRALECEKPVEVRVYILEQDEYRMIQIDKLQYSTNGWGERIIEGFVLEGGYITRVILHDNPVDANPLNLTK